MNHQQGGAEFIGKKTKTQLKTCIKTDPSLVYLYNTAVVGNGHWSGYANDLPEDTQFTVVGPDPYTQRNWYATVQRAANGKLVVS